MRLKEPSLPHNGNYGNPYTFGAGKLHGGLTQEAMNLLGPVFSFDRMGRGQFECGMVPEKLSILYDQGKDQQLVAHTMSFTPDRRRIPTAQSKEVTFYIIQPASLQAISFAQNLIKDLAASNPKTDLLEPAGLNDSVIAETNGRAKPYIGWLDLTDGFFIFMDYQAFDKTARLFGVKHDISSPSPERSNMARRKRNRTPDIS